MRRPWLGWLGLGLSLAGAAILVLATVIAPPVTTTDLASSGFRTVPGLGQMRVGPGPMMGWTPAGPDRWPPAAPGSAGFVAGTAASPRVVRIVATGQLSFVPASVTVQRGETIEFVVTSMGPTTHEFKVGPAADVAADRQGIPEIAGIGMMETRSLAYTFDGPGPFAFACHEPGHFEAGMVGTIVVVP